MASLSPCTLCYAASRFIHGLDRESLDKNLTMTLIQSHNFDGSAKTCSVGEIRALPDSVLDYSLNWYVASASRLLKTTAWMTMAHCDFDRGGLSDKDCGHGAC